MFYEKQIITFVKTTDAFFCVTVHKIVKKRGSMYILFFCFLPNSMFVCLCTLSSNQNKYHGVSDLDGWMDKHWVGTSYMHKRKPNNAIKNKANDKNIEYESSV